nr:MAG TPA: NinG recombination protein [Caudoviricetes sp.]
MALVDLYSKEDLELIVKDSRSVKEVVRKLGYSTDSGYNGKTVKNRIEEYNIDTSHFRKRSSEKRTFENTFIDNSSASQHALRIWYKRGEYTPYKCSICGQEPEWMGKPLTLILDHINGKNKDDRLENLRWVCPNCNQQLDTTGFRNPNRIVSARNLYEKRKSEKKICPLCGNTMSPNAKMCISCYEVARKSKIKPTREVLKSLIRTTGFMELGNNYNVTDRAIARWCKQYGLPSTKKEIKSYSDEEWALI